MSNQWCVIVGQPKRGMWNNYAPDMSNVGRQVGSGGNGYTFKTRDEARRSARRMSEGNPYWHYRAERIK